MDDLAEDLRQVFAEEAEHAPPGLSLLATTHARYRRRSRRQVVGRGGVIVAAAVAATALGASLLASGVLAAPLIACGVLKISYDLTLLALFRRHPVD